VLDAALHCVLATAFAQFGPTDHCHLPIYLKICLRLQPQHTFTPSKTYSSMLGHAKSDTKKAQLAQKAHDLVDQAVHIIGI